MKNELSVVVAVPGWEQGKPPAANMQLEMYRLVEAAIQHCDDLLLGALDQRRQPQLIVLDEVGSPLEGHTRRQEWQRVSWWPRRLTTVKVYYHRIDAVRNSE